MILEQIKLTFTIKVLRYTQPHSNSESLKNTEKAYCDPKYYITELKLQCIEESPLLRKPTSLNQNEAFDTQSSFCCQVNKADFCEKDLIKKKFENESFSNLEIAKCCKLIIKDQTTYLFFHTPSFSFNSWAHYSAIQSYTSNIPVITKFRLFHYLTL